jgi:hypothetical protein
VVMYASTVGYERVKGISSPLKNDLTGMVR